MLLVQTVPKRCRQRAEIRDGTEGVFERDAVVEKGRPVGSVWRADRLWRLGQRRGERREPLAASAAAALHLALPVGPRARQRGERGLATGRGHRLRRDSFHDRPSARKARRGSLGRASRKSRRALDVFEDVHHCRDRAVVRTQERGDLARARRGMSVDER